MHTQPLTWDVNLFAPCGSEVPNLFKICISLLDHSSWMILFFYFFIFYFCIMISVFWNIKLVQYQTL